MEFKKIVIIHSRFSHFKFSLIFDWHFKCFFLYKIASCNIMQQISIFILTRLFNNLIFTFIIISLEFLHIFNFSLNYPFARYFSPLGISKSLSFLIHSKSLTFIFSKLIFKICSTKLNFNRQRCSSSKRTISKLTLCTELLKFI